ncbi:hypothetical protein Ancab_020054 [Ancistrocladus abbreviatus]
MAPKLKEGKTLQTINKILFFSVRSLIKVPEPQILPFFKPIDYVELLAQIHEELETCCPDEKSSLYLLQFQVFRGLGEVKLMRRSLRSAWLKASSVHEKIIFGSWLKYEKKGEELEFGPVDVATELHNECGSHPAESMAIHGRQTFKNVIFRIRDEKIHCDRQKIAGLSAPFSTMLMVVLQNRIVKK